MPRKKGIRGEFLGQEFDRRRRRQAKIRVVKDKAGIPYAESIYRGKKSQPKGS